MNPSTEPRSWVEPHWHSDFGEVSTEFEHLRSLAVAIRECGTDLDPQLQTPEPGLMFLGVQHLGETLAEVI
jgi:hypothetical protein